MEAISPTLRRRLEGAARPDLNVASPRHSRSEDPATPSLQWRGRKGGRVRRVERGTGTHYEARGSDMWFKAVGADTKERFSLMERTLPPGGRMPPPHRHAGNEEAYFILDGVVEFHVGPETFTEVPGSFVLVPSGEAHTFGNTSDASARLLVLHAPALDGYFQQLEGLWASSEPPTKDDELELMRRHGMDPAP